MLLVNKGVVFQKFPKEKLVMMEVLADLSNRYRTDVIITGSENENYREEGAHYKGYALDVRTSNLIDPCEFVKQLGYRLGLIPGFEIIYGDDKHLDHIHIGFRSFMSEDYVYDLTDAEEVLTGIKK